MLSEIEAHLGNMRELRDIVGAMRSLASMRMQEAHRALPGIRRYAETMAEAIGGALLLRRDDASSLRRPGGRALVVCMAEHGFVGGFNERLVDATARTAEQDDALFVLGSRGCALATERGHRVAWQHPMASHADGVPETVRRLTTALYREIATGVVTRVDAIFAVQRQGGLPEIIERVVFPLDLAAFAAPGPRQPPLHNLTPDALLEELIADYVLAALTEAAIETLASENAARFAAMAAAHDNISEKLDQLRREASQARQEAITSEILDLVTGSNALGTHWV